MVLSTDSVQTVDASTMLPTATVVRPDRRDRSQSGKNPTVTIVAGVCGGITGILIIAILSVCIACITKRVQVHVHYDGEKKPDNGHRENTPNSSGTLVQMNTAYKQEAPTRIATSGLSNGSSMQHNLAYGTQNQLHEGMEAGSIIGDYERMSGYTVFRHGNQIHRGEETISHLALPMTYITTDQPYYTGEYDDEHSYEHIR